MNFQGQVALITGAGSDGMGRAYCKALGQEGCVIAANDLVAEGCAKTVALLAEHNIQALSIPCDITDSAAVINMVQEVVDHFGRLDILINNAGIGQYRTLEEITDEMFNRMMRVHVYGSFYCCRAAVPIMKERGRGKIINISSTWGMTGWRKAAHYCTAKAAILGLTKALAQELAPYHINVNAIAPGSVVTHMSQYQLTPEELEREKKAVPWGRWANPEEIAYLGAFLCSEEADFITGQVISPNGGQTIVGI